MSNREERIYRWAVWALEAVCVGAMLYMGVPGVRYPLRRAAVHMHYHGRQLVRRAKHWNDPTWLAEMRQVRGQ